ncbi:hypothetical protein TNCV_1758571 [Trichonephila clavipes]|nr:hypothetical protein TNCV_1758571 [Trichonephila clavipes]
MDDQQKSSDPENCKAQLALNVLGVTRFSRIVCNHQSQALSPITAQMNYGAIRSVSKQTVQRSRFTVCISEAVYLL